ncbi:ArsR/SmtB family transcription factor [Luteipulveratus halotolerans]|uniref:ArsR/SmtB family transcription factor n=1 Tax=Luteipulveratus halotolerans TaxID=1631356 RepID=UPI000680AC66|nr:helix-turn-helix domain-containing protein [Luteipulveratus halotolerans]
MTRRTAQDRHSDSAPADDSWPPEGTALIDALVAIHHPTRRRLYEVLRAQGPCSVGRLVELTGLAPGSVSHHLKPLHRSGFVSLAPGLARDTRESWWQAHQRRLSWSSDDYDEGSAAHEIGRLAERTNYEHQERATRQWLRRRHDLPTPWSDSGFSSDAFVAATAEQVDDLQRRLDVTIREWSDACVADREEHPDLERHPVRVVARGFPSDPTWGES